MGDGREMIESREKVGDETGRLVNPLLTVRKNIQQNKYVEILHFYVKDVDIFWENQTFFLYKVVLGLKM